MIDRVRSRGAESWRTVRAVFSNRGLRWLEMGRAAATVGASTYAVTFVVLAYRAGGPDAVAALVAVTTWVAAGSAPIAAVVADRYPRRRVIAGADLSRVLLLLAAVPAARVESDWLIVLLAAVLTAVAAASNSARAALVPVLARSPEELVAANAVAATSSSVASLGGPALAGIAAALGSAEAALVAAAAGYVVSAFAAHRVGPAADPSIERARESGFRREALAGVRAVVASPAVRVVVTLTAGQTLVGGVLGVLLVVAVIETLDFGEAGPGLLAASLAIGGLVGAALLVVGGRRLAVTMGVGLLVWGLPVSLLGLWPEPLIGLALIALVGLGDSLADLSALTLVQRLVPNDVFARALGALRMLFYTLASLGSLLAPLLLGLLGMRAALIAAGLALPALTLALWRPLVRIDAPAPAAPLALLRDVPFLAALPQTSLERLAGSVEPMAVSAGEEIFRQGEAGRGFYVVDEGEVAIELDGREVTRAGPGGYFGEIALLRDRPRTATARATAPTRLYVIGRGEFIDALAADSSALEAANTVVAARLGRAV